jgi:dolichol-phosphate mannosyltransferase
LLVCVPTYTEAENIDTFLNAVFENIPSEARILVIDDNSSDGTARIIENIQSKYHERLHLLRRTEKQALAGAYLVAFAWGLSKSYGFFL